MKVKIESKILFVPKKIQIADGELIKHIIIVIYDMYTYYI